ncbi:hypothetical protein, partial [Streptomyces djakartensis]|uniref:hypothetical protein n=1 Tax=Streptomyces djakartensis TaxID=68193 RepID=UPI0034DF8E35
KNRQFKYFKAIFPCKKSTKTNKKLSTKILSISASISIRNVGNLPKTNLIVKPAHDIMQYQHSIYGSKQQLLTPQPLSTAGAAQSYYGIGGVNYYGLGGSTMNIRSNYDYRDNYNYNHLRKTGSRAEIDMLERETSTQIRVSNFLVF